MGGRRVGLLIAGCAAVLGVIVAPEVIVSQGPWLAAADLLTGSIVVVFGVIAVLRRPAGWTGVLLAAAGAAWFAGDFDYFPGAAGVFGGTVLFVHRAVIAHAILSLPAGRFSTKRARVAILVVYGVSIVPVLWTDAIVTIGAATALVVAALAAGVRAPGRERRARAFGAWAGSIFGAVIALAAVVRATGPTPSATAVAILLYELAFVATAALVLAGALVRQGVVADEVISAADAPGRTMQDALAWALGDRRLRLGRPDSEGGFVDPDGRELSAPTPGRELRTVRDGERVLARIDIAEGALEGTELPLSLDWAIRLDVRNADLRASVRAQVESVAASRRRLVSAADDEERRLEQRLSRGAVSRLAHIEAALDTAVATTPVDHRPAVQELVRAVRAAEHLVAELSAGIYPATLADEGFNAAVERVVAHFPVPVTLTSNAPELTQETALAAYYVIQEGLANTAKHARAMRVDVAVQADDDLVITVTDDGVGGADPRSGLGGLRDRTEAIGGSISLTSPIGVGTTLRAVLPLAGESS